MSNKSKGSKFEQDVASKLSKLGYWCTLLESSKYSGSQAADIICVKNNKAHLIDCKTLETKTRQIYC